MLPIVVIHQTIFNIANHLRDAAKPSEGNDTPMKVNFQEEIKRQLDLETLKAEGIVDILKETILVSIAQNKNDVRIRNKNYMFICLSMYVNNLVGLVNDKYSFYVKRRS